MISTRICFSHVSLLYIDDFIKCVCLYFYFIYINRKGREPGTMGIRIYKAIEGGGGLERTSIFYSEHLFFCFFYKLGMFSTTSSIGYINDLEKLRTRVLEKSICKL